MKAEIFLDEFDLAAEREGSALRSGKELTSTFKPKKKRQGMSLLTIANANRAFNSRVGCGYISR